MLALLFGFFIIRAIMRSLTQAMRVANSIAAGDLTVSINVASQDEVGQLHTAMRTMVQRLRDVVGRVRLASGNITVSTAEIVQGNGDLSQRTQEQAAALEETASSTAPALLSWWVLRLPLWGLSWGPALG